MPQFSDFTPFGLFEFSSELSEAEKFYQASVDAMPGIDVESDPHLKAELYATAMAQGCSAHALRLAGNQADPQRSGPMLDVLEDEYQIVVPPGATISDRRAKLSAVSRLQVGGALGNVLAALTDLLGDGFIDIRPLSYPSEVETWPADPGDGPSIFRDVREVSRSFELVDALTLKTMAGTVDVQYKPHGVDDSIRLQVGDVVVLSPENGGPPAAGDLIGLAERVTVLAVSESSGSLYFRCAHAKPHDEGSIVFAGHWPMWWSTTRHLLIVVTPEVATDQSKRSEIDLLLQKLLRATNQWSIVQGVGGNVGPYQLGVSPLGCVPIDTLAI